MADDATVDLTPQLQRDAVTVPGAPTRAPPTDAPPPDPADIQRQLDRDRIAALPKNPDGSTVAPKAADSSFMGRTWHSFRDMAEMIPGVPYLEAAPGKIYDAATGAGRIGEPDTPELDTPGRGPGLGFAASGRLAASYLAGATPEGLAKVAQDAIPGSTVSDDGRGNPIIVMPDGGRYYLNKPGLSTADIEGGAGRALMALPFARAAGGLAAVAGMGGDALLPLGVRAALQGAGQGAASVASDLASRLTGTGDRIDPVQAVFAAGGGAAGEPVGLALGKLGEGLAEGYQRLFGSRSTPLADDAGKLTTAGAQVFKAAGVDVSGLTPDQLKAVSDRLGRTAPELAAQPPTAPLPGTRAAAGPNTVARAVTSAKTGVPLTEAQLTGDPGQLATEDLLRHGSGEASTIMNRAKGQSAEAVDAEVARLIPGAAPGAVPGEEDIGNALKTQIKGHANALDAATKAAYANPKLDFLANPGGMWATGPSATFSSGAAQTLMDRMKAISGEFAIDADLTPMAAKARQAVSELITTPAEDTAPGVEGVAHMQPFPPAPPPMLRPFNVADADQTLRRLDAAYDGAKSNTDRTAIAQMRRGLYNTIDNAQAAGTLSGDADVLTAWKQARAAAKAKFDFKAPDNDAAKDFVNTTLTGGTSGQAVLNDLFGAGQLGGKASTVPVLDHLAGQMGGAGSPVMTTAKQAAATRLLLGGTTRASAMDAGNLAFRIDQATRGPGRAITQRLFDPSDMAAMGDVGDVQRILQQSGKRSTAGTAYTNVDAFGRYLRRFPALKFLYDPAEAQTARDVAAAHLATAPTLRPGSFRQPVSPLAGGVRGSLPILGGLLGQDYGRE